MKIKSLIWSLLLFTTSLLAQKPIVGITEFGRTSFQDSIAAKIISEKITTALIQSKRFEVLPISDFKSVKSEIDRNKSEDYINSDVVKQGRLKGAKWLVVGNVTLTEVYLAKAGGSYNARVDFSLRRINVETGVAEDAENFSGTKTAKTGLGGLGDIKIPGVNSGTGTAAATNIALAEGAYKKMDEASRQAVGSVLSDAADNANKKVRNWLAKTFGMRFYLLEVEKAKKEKKKETIDYVKSITVQGGKEVGMTKGDKLKVVFLREFKRGDETILDYKLVAKLTITELRENTAVCKVTDSEGETNLIALKEEELGKYFILFDEDDKK